MILFDYGNTLIHEAGWNTLNGQKAVFEHVKFMKKIFHRQETSV